jgi:ribokinase
VTPPGAVVVLGSANTDLVLNVSRLPAAGETLLAARAERLPGGKGANQAVAAARGATTTFLAAVGDDAEGATLRAVMQDAGVGLAALRTATEPTGLAVVLVDDAGQNSIVVAPGANAAMTELREDERAVIRDSRVLLCQLEIPLTAVSDAVATAREAGVTVVLNAAPSQPLPRDVWLAIDILVVNEHEAADLAPGSGDLEATVDALLELIPTVIVTLGSEGASWASRDGTRQRTSAPKVDAVDTTGAGDTFCGVLAASIAAGATTATAVERAIVAASLSVGRRGAIPSIPTSDEIDEAVAAGSK